jgi:hypothetical protein
MPTFRVILQGEATYPHGRRFGFFAARQVIAASEAEAAVIVEARTRTEWGSGPSRDLGRLDRLSAVLTWPVRLAWFRRPRGGFCLYDDSDADTLAAAYRIESRAAGAPQRGPFALQSRPPRKGSVVILGCLALPVLPVAMIAGLLSRPVRRTREKVVRFLEDFLHGTGGDDDWDEFTSVPIEDPELEGLRRRADAIRLPMDDAGRETLRALLEEAKVIAARSTKA